MNRFSLYIFLILIFLGLSKNFSPSVVKIYQMKNIAIFGETFKEDNFSILLLDTFKTGFMIKTYFLKLKIAYPFKPSEVITVRTSYDLFTYYKQFLGMSLYRIGENMQDQDSTPMPPGTLFVGNPAYGRWKLHDSGERYWKFHRAYQRFPNLFFWGDFRPSFSFYKSTKASLKNNIPYFGDQNQFGIDGSITKKALNTEDEQASYIKIKLKKYIKKYISTPPWKITAEKVN